MDGFPPLARNADPVTSHEAAESVDISAGQRIVLDALAHGPMTDEEIYDRVVTIGARISPSGCRTRRCELVRLGQVVGAGYYGRTRAGRWAVTWRLIGR